MAELTEDDRRFRRGLAGIDRAAPRGQVGVAGTGSDVLRRLAAVVGAVEEGGTGLAAALGRTLSGRRTTAFVGAEELGASGREQLVRAAALRLPLVVHLELDAAAPSLELARESGAVVLVAPSLQAAVDLALVGRRVAEAALVPVVVAADGRETFDAVQEAMVPSAASIRAFLGEAEATIHARTPAEEEIFGRHRRRLPRWHDAARPLLAGARLDSAASAAASLARRIYFDRAGLEIETALDAFAEACGRRYETIRQHRLRGAKLVLVTLGAAVEMAEGVADALTGEGVRVGVLGLHDLEPFPAAELVPLLAGHRRVLVLEQEEGASSGGEPPLTAEVRAALARALGGPRQGGEGEPHLAPRQMPAVGTALWGLGGGPRRAADLAELCRRAAAERGPGRSPVVVGVEPLASSSRLPKRRVLFDGLRRHYPQARDAGVRGGEGLDLPGGEAIVVEASGEGAAQLLRSAADLLVDAAGGSVRSRLETNAATLSWSPRILLDPGDAPAAHVHVVTAAGPRGLGRERLAGLRTGGKLLLPSATIGLTPGAAALLEQRRLEIFAPGAEEAGDPERTLGALAALLAERTGVERRALVAARRKRLEARAPGDVEEGAVRFESGWEGLQRVDRETLPQTPAPSDAPLVDAALAAGPADGPPVASLARFWDQVGVLERAGGEEELAADPCLVAGAVPALADALRDVSAERAMLPVFDPALCTGCGACWSLCPHGAVAPLVGTPAGLVELGMERAQETGRGADALRPLVSKVAGGLRRELSAEGYAGGELGEPLAAAFARALESAPLPDARRQAMEAAFSGVRSALDELPVARTAPFFDAAEAREKGSGTLLSIALSPQHCTGCGVCVAVCEPEALVATPDDDEERRERELARWRLATAAPVPSPELLAGLRATPEVGPLVAMLLEGPARRVMSGGDAAPPGEGSAIVLRQVLGVVAASLAPLQEERRSALEEARASLAGSIHEELARALPEDDLGALARGLDAVELPDVDLGELSGRVEGALEAHRVDVPRLRELVAVARRLSDVALEEAESRRRAGVFFSLVVGPGAALEWARRFPHDPFAVPTVADATGGTIPLARGVLEAGRVAAVDEARLLRRARRLVKGGPPGDDERILRFEQLDETERRACPPVVVAVAEGSLASNGAGLASLVELLGGELPILVLLLSDGGLPAPGRTAEGAPIDWETLLVSQPLPFVAQCSPAAPNHLARCLTEALESGGPAVVRVHAPSPARHGFATDRAPERAELAVASRAFPLLRRSASRGEVVPPLDLASNPDPTATWSGGATPAHWALGEARFAAGLTSLGDGEEGALPVEELVALATEERSGKVPVIEDDDGGRWRVGRELVRGVEARARVWAALRSLASVAEVEEERRTGRTPDALEERHREELEHLREEYEGRIAGLRTAVQGELAQRLRSRLLTLARRRRPERAVSASEHPDPAEEAASGGERREPS